jgi:predicted ATPase
VIVSVGFKRFKALRNADLELQPFNLVVGPNGSGKSSLIQAILRLRRLAKLHGETPPSSETESLTEAPGISWSEVIYRCRWGERIWTITLRCSREAHCDLWEVRDESGNPISERDWPGLRSALISVRVFLLDHYAMAQPFSDSDGDSDGKAVQLASNGANLAALLHSWSEHQPSVLAGFRTDVLTLFPEYEDLRISDAGEGKWVELKLGDEADWVRADELSQGTLYGLALCALAHEPKPAAVVCIEELDRGLHPRLLREVRDVVYRLSYPQDQGLQRTPVQVLATTHSPYLLDLFKDHPEEVVIAHKEGRQATFHRLVDQPGLGELLEEGSLGDVWYAGILGGVPEDK